MSSDKPDYPDAPEPISPWEQIMPMLLMNRTNTYGPNGSNVSGRMGANGQFQAWDPSDPRIADAMNNQDWGTLMGLLPNATQITESENDAARRGIGTDYLNLFRGGGGSSGAGGGRGLPGGGASYLPSLASMPEYRELDVNKYRWPSTRPKGNS